MYYATYQSSSSRVTLSFATFSFHFKVNEKKQNKKSLKIDYIHKNSEYQSCEKERKR